MKILKIVIIFLIMGLMDPTEILTQNLNKQKTKVIIQGMSSVIIETQNQKSDLFADKIITQFGGNFIKRIYNSNTLLAQRTDNLKVSSAIPKNFNVLGAYPNPFNPSTTIKYSLPKVTQVEVTIFNLIGNVVNKHSLGVQTPGWYEYSWNGTNSLNQRISSGIYIIGIKTDYNYTKQKITYLE